MKRKIYISINLPKQTRKRLIRAVEKWQDLPVKWTKEDNLHVTLLFLGFVDDDAAYDICEKVVFATQEEEIFDIEFDSLELGPNADDPRMIWVSGKSNAQLLSLVEKIEKELNIFVSAKKEFFPHITLGRIRKNKWEELAEKPVIKKDFPLVVGVESVDVMASDFESDSGEYAIVESCPLN